MEGMKKAALIASCLACALIAAEPAALAVAPKKGVSPVDPLARKITGSPNYISMFGIRATITQEFSVSGFIAVDAGLDIKDSRVRKQVNAIRPRIMDALRVSLASYANGPYRLGEAPNLDMLRARMQRAVDRQLGKDAAQVVLASVIVFTD